MPCDNKAILKTLQVLVCGSGLIYKVWTMWESERVIVALEKISQEGRWPGFTQPTSLSSIFIDLSFGAYFIVSLSFLIGHISGDPTTTAERLLMVAGLIMMILVGGILILSADEIPDKLLDNAIILGILAFLAGVLFLTDAGTKCQNKERRKRAAPATQPKRQIEIVPKTEERQVDIIQPSESSQQKETEQRRDKGTHKGKTKENGIKSVEIRIKDPPKDWSGYGHQRPVKLPQIASLEEAERVDAMLHAEREEEPVPTQSRQATASVQASPVRHTSSFYIGGPFSWRRLNNEQVK